MTGGNWRGATRKRRCLFGLFAFAVYPGLGLGPCQFVGAQIACPEGVTDNLALWLKADGDAVASWADEPATIFVVFSDEGTDTQVAGLFSAYAGAGA